MDGLKIQAKVYAGRAKAAQRIGLDCTVYRPVTAANPFTNTVATIKAAFNAGDSTYLHPNLYGKPVWYADMDGRITQEGDYLVRVLDGQVYFVAAQQQLLPIVVIDCPRTVRITRQVPVTAVGAVGYGGLQPANNVDVVGGIDSPWPASILLGGKTGPALGLPADVKNAGWRILLPPSLPLTIVAGDILTDDLDRRFIVEAAELTDMGWRLMATEGHV